MLKIAITVLTSLVFVTPVFAQQTPSDPACEAVTKRVVDFRQLQLDRYNELVAAVDSGSSRENHQAEITFRSEIFSESYGWLKLLSYSSVNGYTSNCVEIHYKLRGMGY